ncbi:bacteriophage N4 adsorption protein B [Symmachiella macrocystis]|uniref:Bacteriophage N4 adsorption protein B n=1 Tax=Symmachiella macrocystis TaxID=2527985 RepID=A0A5C6B664_9PLAN|nr:hypothetical protein [Symmachiella macrocystis]TWU06809.1 bacteriophage N4 adsorption protein B [Symmachiella macrocystis]
MEISSRTPEGDDNQCAICGKPVVIEPSQPPGDAPCPHCGCLLWFGANSSLLGDSSEDLSEQEVASILQEHPISMQIIEMIPESIARENTVIPLALESEALIVAIHDPMAYEVLDKLRFILDRDVDVVLASKEAIQAAINRHYGQSETESVDSMLAEFTETAIDFTETDYGDGIDSDEPDGC